MSIVSSSNLWLFISSSGGLSAGRVSAEQSLFPYYTEDKLTDNSESTGNKAILLVTRGQRTSLWEPFSQRQQGVYAIERAIYKNVPGESACGSLFQTGSAEIMPSCAIFTKTFPARPWFLKRSISTLA